MDQPGVDQGPPISYLLLARDTPVYDSDGVTVGTVKKVLCEPGADIFDGLVVACSAGDHYVPAEQVAAIHERGVDVSITCARVVASPEPPQERQIKWDLDEPPPRLWDEIERWLLEHLPLHHPQRDGRLEQAEQRLADRQRALRLANENPELALELGIGRPDLASAEHGYVVDINHAPVDVIAALPGLDAHTAAQIVGTRERISGFDSIEDLGMVLDLPGGVVEHLRDHVVCLPY